MSMAPPCTIDSNICQRTSRREDMNRAVCICVERKSHIASSKIRKFRKAYSLYIACKKLIWRFPRKTLYSFQDKGTISHTWSVLTLPSET